jgi:hypothetical protein
MHVVPFPIQFALFQAVAAKFKKRSHALEDYQRRFQGVSASTCRARFNGTTGITYDHGMEVARAYQLREQSIWSQGLPQNELLVTFSSVRPDIDAFLAMQLRDFNQMAQRKTVRTHLVMHDVPFFILKKHRRMAGLLLYFHLCFEAGMPYFRKIPFGAAFLQEPQVQHWLDQGRAMLECYQQVPGTEYWSPHMLDVFLRKVRLMAEYELFESPTVLAEIKEDIDSFIDDLEKVLENGQKLHGQQPLPIAKVQVYDHRGFAPGNILLAASEQDGSFVYQELQLFKVARFDTEGIDFFQQQIEFLASTSHNIPATGVKKNEFVAKLRQHVDILLHVLR